MKQLVGIVFLLAVSCAAPLTEDELFRREYNEKIDEQNWELCREVYRRSGVRLAVSDHAHGKGKKHYPFHVRRDLIDNNCKRILGAYWAERL